MLSNRGKAILRVLLIVPATLIVLELLYVVYSFISALLLGLGPDTFTAELALMLTGLGFVTTAYLFWTMWDKKPFREIGFDTTHRRAVWDFTAGSLLGIAVISLALLAAFALGYVEFTGMAKSKVVHNVVMGFLVYLSVAFAEEIVSRGYMMTVLAQNFGPVFAILGSSVVFSALHLLNPNLSIIALANLLLAGILLAFSYYRTKALWFPIGLHFTWNLMQGTVFSLEVSGMEARGLWRVLLTGPEHLTGGQFGLEGGVIITALTLLAFAAVELYARRVAQSVDS